MVCAAERDVVDARQPFARSDALEDTKRLVSECTILREPVLFSAQCAEDLMIIHPSFIVTWDQTDSTQVEEVLHPQWVTTLFPF